MLQNHQVWLAIICLVLTAVTSTRAQHPEQNLPVSQSVDRHLVYFTDEQGNRVPDFSYAGYMAGEQPIPDVAIQVVVAPGEGDDTQRIQSALDYVASLPADKDGIRGAVLLESGNYQVAGSLTINAPGVVLRGSGMGKDGTVVEGTGQSRKTLIRIAGKNDRSLEQEVKVTDAYVPVNAMSFKVEKSHRFREGDKVLIRRPSTEKWIRELGMSHFGGATDWLGWKPGERDIYWDRTVTEVNGNTISIDAPLTTALDTAYGGGKIAAYQWPGRITQTGVENLRLVSAYDENNPKDEAHRWMAITLESVQDAWVRQVVFEHFAGSAVAVLGMGRRITVEDCKSLNPVSEIGGQRRYTFWTKGQQTLFQRLYAEYGYHDFAAGYLSSLNAFVQCESYLPYSFSGTINSWASGILYDVVNVDGGALRFFNRGQEAQGAGWTAANSMFWQCSAAKVECQKPPTADNWAFGTWAQFAGNGYWGSNNDHTRPRSLYYAQLTDRLGDGIMNRAHLLPLETGSYTSPTIDQADSLTAEVVNSAPQLSDWIDQAAERNPIPTDAAGAKVLEQPVIAGDAGPSIKQAPSMFIKNGWLVRGNSVLTGMRHGVRWWRGGVRPYDAEEATPHITRFVPGHYGRGLTDSLNQVAGWMKNNHIAALEHNYGLWYDRRRDDHQRVRRMNGDVWAPFYELPFARSGKGVAWDGLSKYDLTKYNSWYWNRLSTFADLADQKGLVLIHQNYFQHNILEAGAHWADFPWRTANNINQTGFPEPPPYAGDKRIFMSKQFYDVTHSVRREIHRSYIRKCMDNFMDNSGVIHFISAEYTGPLHFVRFWIDIIKEWEEDKGDNKAFIGLSTTKDVQDAILGDSKYARTVDLIDIRYWHYREDGSLYAPEGGKYLAPRQHARLVDPGKSSFEYVYQAVREYREKHPNKAVMYSGKGSNEHAWAVFMAGGSLAAIPQVYDPEFLTAASGMKPIDPKGRASSHWALGNQKGGYIIYSRSPGPIELDLSDVSGAFEVYRIDPENGQLLKRKEYASGGNMIEIQNSHPDPVVIWVKRV